MPQGNRGWRKRVLEELNALPETQGAVNIHYNYDYEVARIVRKYPKYKMRFHNGPYSVSAKTNAEVIKALEAVVEPLEKKKLIVYYG